MIRHPQEDHADLGLVDDDDTPDMRKPPAATRGLQFENSIHQPKQREVQ